MPKIIYKTVCDPFTNHTFYICVLLRLAESRSIVCGQRLVNSPLYTSSHKENNHNLTRAVLINIIVKTVKKMCAQREMLHNKAPSAKTM